MSRREQGWENISNQINKWRAIPNESNGITKCVLSNDLKDMNDKPV